MPPCVPHKRARYWQQQRCGSTIAAATSATAAATSATAATAATATTSSSGSSGSAISRNGGGGGGGGSSAPPSRERGTAGGAYACTVVLPPVVRGKSRLAMRMRRLHASLLPAHPAAFHLPCEKAWEGRAAA